MRKLRTEELNRISVDEFKAMHKLPVVVVLDDIRSGLNVGSVFRTADAFAIRHIYLCGITVHPPHREILKSAIGATESVSWSANRSTTDCLEGLQAEGYTLIGIEQTSESKSLNDFEPNPDKPIALVFGNEVEGISEAALPLMTMCLEIPQSGTKHSLNIAVCAGIVLWYCSQRIISKSTQ